LSTWLCRIARNFWLADRRKQSMTLDRITLLQEAQVAPSEERPDTRLREKEISLILRVAINRLSADHREAVVLCDLRGFSTADAATAAGSPKEPSRAGCTGRAKVACIASRLATLSRPAKECLECCCPFQNTMKHGKDNEPVTVAWRGTSRGFTQKLDAHDQAPAFSTRSRTTASSSRKWPRCCRSARPTSTPPATGARSCPASCGI
jgi:hypothetical protein